MAYGVKVNNKELIFDGQSVDYQYVGSLTFYGNRNQQDNNLFGLGYFHSTGLGYVSVKTENALLKVKYQGETFTVPPHCSFWKNNFENNEPLTVDVYKFSFVDKFRNNNAYDIIVNGNNIRNEYFRVVKTHTVRGSWFLQLNFNPLNINNVFVATDCRVNVNGSHIDWTLTVLEFEKIASPNPRSQYGVMTNGKQYDDSLLTFTKVLDVDPLHNGSHTIPSSNRGVLLNCNQHNVYPFFEYIQEEEMVDEDDETYTDLYLLSCFELSAGTYKTFWWLDNGQFGGHRKVTLQEMANHFNFKHNVNNFINNRKSRGTHVIVKW